MVYFTADLHLGHQSILTMHNRPFADVEEMNKTLIANYNSVVRPGDTVYILGDLTHHLTPEQADGLISHMGGKKILVRGNHDKGYSENYFADICDFTTMAYNGARFALMHYPMLCWPKMRSGSFMLHGHIHSDGQYNLKNLEAGILRYDVGVDANGYYPVSAEQIIDFFADVSRQRV